MVRANAEAVAGEIERLAAAGFGLATVVEIECDFDIIVTDMNAIDASRSSSSPLRQDHHERPHSASS